jgi:ABC-type uncharacterized transport system ATPase subunit
VFIGYEGDGSFLSSLPMVARANDYGKEAELVLRDGTAPDELLSALVGRIRIRSFEAREPSLHEIFVRSVRGAGEEAPGGNGGA